MKIKGEIGLDNCWSVSAGGVDFGLVGGNFGLAGGSLGPVCSCSYSSSERVGESSVEDW